MRIKKFTLLTLALVMSVVAFAQKPVATSKKKVLTPYQQILQAKRQGLVNEQNAKDFKFAQTVLPQNLQKAKTVNHLSELKMQNLPKKLFDPAKAKASRSARRVGGSFTYSFLRDMNGWTEIDADGDGYSWTIMKTEQILGHGGEAGCMTSESYKSSVGALSPDNYLVSPKMKLDGKITFWACGQDASWAAEHFGVAVSTASGTDPDDFTTIQEWTMTAAPSLAPSANFNAPAGAFRSPQRVQGNWYQYTYDLSSYAGAEGYVAIRHFGCTDMFCLNVDDITLETSELLDPYDESLEQPIDPSDYGTLVTPPTSAEVVAWYTYDGAFYANTSSGWTDATDYMPSVNVAIDGSDFYIQGLGYYFLDGWVKGTLSGTTVTIPSGQYIGYDEYGPEYIVGSDDGSTACDIVFTYDAEAGLLTSETTYIVESGESDDVAPYCYWAQPVFSLTAPEVPTQVEVPAGLETEEYLFQAINWDLNNDEYTLYEIPVFVGFDGNDVYVQGVCEDIPEAWIKGTLDGGKITFPTGQYFGTIVFWGYEFPYFFAGYGDYGFEDVVMAYDAENGVLTMESPDFLLINASNKEVDPNLVFLYATITKVPDVAATPAQPEITGAKLTGTSYPYISVNIPLIDEDGNPIQSSKLSYQYYYEIDHVQNPLTLTTDLYTMLSSDMTEIPYSFSDDYDIYNYKFYLNMDFSSWNKIGIQSIYRGGGEENRSEIFWYVIAPYMHNATFVAADEFSIQNGNATVKVDDNKIDVDSEGKAEIPEASTVTLNAANGYVFVSATSSDATVTMAEDGLSASFEMPAKDVTVNYQVRELGKDIQFTSTNEFSIQGGQADLDINGDIVDLDASGLITDIAKGSTITLSADPAFKFTEVQATYIPKTTDPDPVINYTLVDSYGDGWNGGQVEIVKVSTSEVIATLTLESGALAEGSVDLEPGESYEINYTAGNYASENSFVFTDAEGNEIASGSGSDGTRTLAIYTAPAAPDPVDLDYTLASNGSTITFTVPNGNVSLTYTLEHRGVPVTIPAGKYVTYYSNEGAIVFDEGVQLMTVVSITDKTVNVEACDAIPALTPMLIYNSNGADTEAWIVSTDELGMTISSTVTVCDEFKGTLTEKTFTEDDMAAKDYYVCTGQDFVWVPNAGSIAANKCWIELSKDQPQSTRAIVIGDETTGIAGVSNKVVDGQWYDLNGRKLEQKPTAKGVYIVNGKKQVIK